MKFLSLQKVKNIDARWWQILIQSTILFVAAITGAFSHHFLVYCALFMAAIFYSKVVWGKVSLSIFNTLLSLLILIRMELWWAWLIVGPLALCSKHFKPLGKSHIFNPSNFAIVVLLLCLPQISWIQPGAWARSGGLIVFAIIAGLLLTWRVRTISSVVTFLLTYAGLHYARALGLGDPLSIPTHNLINGSLFIFSFFAFSDPKTSPKSPGHQIIYATIVAMVSFALEFSLFIRGSWFYALFFANLLSPLFKFLYLNPFEKEVICHSNALEPSP